MRRDYTDSVRRFTALLTLMIAFACALWLLCVTGCADLPRQAARAVDTSAKIVLVTEARLQRTARTALTVLAEEEGAALGRELKRLGCPTGAASQPESAPVACQDAARANAARYELRATEITLAVERADQIVEALKTTLRLIIEVLEGLDDKSLSLASAGTQLPPLLTSAAKLLADAQAAYADVKALIGGGK